MSQKHKIAEEINQIINRSHEIAKSIVILGETLNAILNDPDFPQKRPNLILEFGRAMGYLQKSFLCETCQGSGWDFGECSNCKGTGIKPDILDRLEAEEIINNG